MGRFLVGITGASGAIYGQRLVAKLIEAGHRVELVVTEAGKKVITHELGNGSFGGVEYYGIGDLLAPPASGSVQYDGMIIVPCSMGTVAAVANGLSSNLLQRAADVALKEGRTLVLVPRETPLHAGHLRNLLTVAELGARIVPAMPAFYQHPGTVGEMVDFVVARVLNALGLPQNLQAPWDEYKGER